MNIRTLNKRLEDLLVQGITLITEPKEKKYYFSIDSNHYDVSQITQEQKKEQRLPVIQEIIDYLEGKGWTTIFEGQRFGWTLGKFYSGRKKPKKVRPQRPSKKKPIVYSNNYVSPTMRKPTTPPYEHL